MADIEKALNLQAQGKLDEAAEIYKEFLAENPKQPDVSNLLGQIYFQKKDYETAETLFKIAIEGFSCAEFWQNLAFLYLDKENFSQAMTCFEKVIDFEPNNINVIREIAQIAKRVGQRDYAIKFFSKAIELDKKDSVGLNQLGLLYEEKHDYLKAKDCYIRSLKIKENFEAEHNLGVLYRTLRNFDESIKCLHRALKYRPNYQETLVSLGMSYLSKKDFLNGKKYYQVLKPEDKKRYRNHWDGKKHPEATLFVFYYAGFGDHIMLSRYLPYLKNYFKTVKVWLHRDMKILLEKNFEGIEFVDTPPEEYDYSANIMELHFLLDMDFDNIPQAKGYLEADSVKIVDYKKHFFATEKPKVGLFWQGNKKVFPNRSIKLKELAPLLELKNIEFYSFEKGDEDNQIAEFPELADVGGTFKNYGDTAAALMNLDLLITIDSSIAHLAGALGVKTFLLLPYASEWRWFDDEETTPWYDSVRIFKQKEAWCWNEVVMRVNNELQRRF